MKLFIFVLASFMMACAHQPSITKAVKTKSVAKNTRSKSEDQSWKREQALVLAKKNQDLKPDRVVGRADPQKKKLKLKVEPILAHRKTSEKVLLTELQDRFDNNDEIGFQSRYQALQNRFSKSPRLSEAHYMAGLLALSNKSYGQSLRAFDQILRKKRDPQASKALFAKAMVYRKMNLLPTSRELLSQVIAQYPKSFEAQRASVELKILEKRFQ